jgi:hypothetical protein
MMVKAVGSLRYDVVCRQIIYIDHLILREVFYLKTLPVAKIRLLQLQVDKL